MNAAKKLPLLLTVTLLLGACATTSIDSRRRGAEPGLYGVADGRLITIGQSSSFEILPKGGERNTVAEMSGVGAMTWDPEAGRFYAVADASSKPRLIAIDPATGEATAIGPIATFGIGLTLADALALDPRDGSLYAAGGKSAFAASILLKVDPATGKAQQVARIRGTIQDEVDALAFAGDELYAVDGAGNSAALYRIDTDTGQASRVSQPFPGTVTDLAFDPAGQRLLGAPGTDGPLFTFSLDGDVGEMPAAGAVTAVAVIPAAEPRQDSTGLKP